jgi:hypothetical protein
MREQGSNMIYSNLHALGVDTNSFTILTRTFDTGISQIMYMSSKILQTSPTSILGNLNRIERAPNNNVSSLNTQSFSIVSF